MIIGSHVSFKKNQLLDSVKEAISYNANTFMFYTGAPQNTLRSKLDDEKTKEALKLMKENNIDINNVVCHAPYIVNLANNKELEKYRFSISFLTDEIKRCEALGIKRIVLHPGSSVGIERKDALKNIIYALNMVLENAKSVIICLETMAGKGTELGINTDELKTIIDGIEKQELIGVCLDTCHLNDSGVDLNNFDEYLEDFDKKIGLDKVKVIHINDSKNVIGSHKDRHENIGFGTIGYSTLVSIINDKRFENIPKILETPYVGDSDDDKNRLYPPYKYEIEMIKKGQFDIELKNNIRKEYKK